MSGAAIEKTAADNGARRLARLAAVQALYRMTMTECPARDVIREFRLHPAEMLGEAAAGAEAPQVDQELFAAIVSGVEDGRDTIDAMIAGALDARLSPDRLEVLLRSILRAGVFELHHHGAVAPGIVINDYVDVAHVFFNDREPGLINALLDRIGKALR